MKIVCVGDSNTYGYDPRSFIGDRYDESTRWTGLLQSAGFEVVNLGMNGAQIPYRPASVEYLKQRLEPLRPMDHVTLMLGSNDLLMGFPPEQAALRMANLLDALTDYPVLLLAPIRMQPGAWVESPEIVEAVEKLASHCAALAEKRGLPFFDPGLCDLTYDGVHLSPEGHRQFAERLMKRLEQ